MQYFNFVSEKISISASVDFTLEGMEAATSLFLLLHMRKSFCYKHFPEMSIPLKK